MGVDKLIVVHPLAINGSYHVTGKQARLLGRTAGKWRDDSQLKLGIRGNISFFSM